MDKLCVSKLCVDKLCVDKLFVSKLCVSKLCVSKLRAGGGRAGMSGQAEVHNQKQEPHTKMWAKTTNNTLNRTTNTTNNCFTASMNQIKTMIHTNTSSKYKSIA